MGLMFVIPPDPTILTIGRPAARSSSLQECAGPKPLKINKYHYGGMGLRGNHRWFDPAARSGRSDFLTS
jgi:hypothetical protein